MSYFTTRRNYRGQYDRNISISASIERVISVLSCLITDRF